MKLFKESQKVEVPRSIINSQTVHDIERVWTPEGLPGLSSFRANRLDIALIKIGEINYSIEIEHVKVFLNFLKTAM